PRLSVSSGGTCEPFPRCRTGTLSVLLSGRPGTLPDTALAYEEGQLLARSRADGAAPTADGAAAPARR
ncbi:hypothetical protein ACWDFH_16005, partial [Streptomyces kronopolitis]